MDTLDDLIKQCQETSDSLLKREYELRKQLPRSKGKESSMLLKRISELQKERYQCADNIKLIEKSQKRT